MSTSTATTYAKRSADFLKPDEMPNELIVTIIYSDKRLFSNEPDRKRALGSWSMTLQCSFGLIELACLCVYAVRCEKYRPVSGIQQEIAYKRELMKKQLSWSKRKIIQKRTTVVNKKETVI